MPVHSEVAGVFTIILSEDRGCGWIQDQFRSMVRQQEKSTRIGDLYQQYKTRLLSRIPGKICERTLSYA